ncbi:hypothetical protein [Larkinella soli]|uniref:hypothetical protein n=1 Tax=Larkinella soli TaxID=1770527 RepID=UPI000FFC00A5|nr:hypothetical protein [Larkinella soli]
MKKTLLLLTAYLCFLTAFAQEPVDPVFVPADTLTPPRLLPAQPGHLQELRRDTLGNTYLMNKAKKPVQVSAVSISQKSQFKRQYAPEVIYKGQLFERKAGTVTAATPGYDYAIFPAQTGYYYEIIVQEGISVKVFGALGIDGPDYTTNLAKARAYAEYRKLALLIPAGVFRFAGLTLAVDSLVIRGVPLRSILKKTSTRGNGIDIHANHCRVFGVTVDGNASQLDGGFWVTGIGNDVDQCRALNCDAFSFCINGTYSNGAAFVKMPTAFNRVRNSEAKGQKRYHSIGAKAAFLAGDSAVHTLFENDRAIDCFLPEAGDYFDSDWAPYTRFLNCTAQSTSGLSGASGLHTEGEQPSTNHYVYIENFTAINMLRGFSFSENSRVSMTGNNQAIGCQRALVNYSAYTSSISGLKAIGCGSGISGLISAVIENARSATLSNVEVIGTVGGAQELLNYNGAPANSTEDPLTIRNSVFNGPVRFSNDNVGSYFVDVSGTAFNNSSVDWYNNVGLRITFTGCVFRNTVVSGARAKRIEFNGCRFVTANNTQVALNYPITDNINTLVRNSHFDGFNRITDWATLGLGITYANLVNPPKNLPEDRFVQGGDNTRSTYVSSLDQELQSGFYTASGSGTGSPFSQATPYNVINLHETNGGTSYFGHPSGYFTNQIAMDIAGGPMYRRFHNGGGSWQPWHKVHDNSWFPVDITASPVLGQTIRFDGTRFVQGKLGVTDLQISGTPDGTKFLRDDGSWAAPAGGSGTGDMAKATYDANSNNKVDGAESADAVPWTGVTGKPSSFTPSAHTHPLAEIQATGTRDATTFLRGDGTFAVPPGGGGGSYTDEQAQDAAASLVTSGFHLGVKTTYDDALNRLSLTAITPYYQDYLINGIALETAPLTNATTTDANLGGSGVALFREVVAPLSVTIDKVAFHVAVVGSGLSATAGANGVGLYDISGNRLAWADCQTAFTTTGFKTVSLNTNVTLVAGSRYRIVAVATGSTSPQFRVHSSASLINANVNTSPYRQSTKGSTTLDATLTFGSGWTAETNSRAWIGFTVLPE